jgi:hypothetical protein
MTASGPTVASAGSFDWSDYTVSASVEAGSGGTAEVVARYQDAGDFYACGLQQGSLWLGKRYGGAWYTFASTAYPYDPGSFYRVSFQLHSEKLSCSVSDPATGSSATLSAQVGYFEKGAIGVVGSGPAEFDDVLVTGSAN